MRQIETVHAVGHVLCHDLTRIIPGEWKGAQFRKGHVVTEEDIPMLLSMGKDHLFVWEMDGDHLHENDAALRLGALCQNEWMKASEIREGKLELSATRDGLFTVDTERLEAINSLDEIMIATRHTNTAVKAGDKLCGTRVIPLVIARSQLEKAEEIGAGKPLLTLTPFKPLKAAVVTTGNEVFHKRIEDKFTPIVQKKLEAFGIQNAWHITTDDAVEHIREAIEEMRRQKADLILCTGGMSVDPDDCTPAAIRQSGARIVTYGAPVLPGAMLLVGYYADGVSVLGLPGCVMYAKATVFDLVLPRVAAGVEITKRDIVKLGCGGLCLNCKVCTYPDCGFGKES
ncbi:MAG: molybdopterin-binding protein [Eubacteriales bacterium]|nr:molybdopterin-binding protein [Eubacteriales bacterium]